jgi:hypothetical protein
LIRVEGRVETGRISSSTNSPIHRDREYLIPRAIPELFVGEMTNRRSDVFCSDGLFAALQLLPENPESHAGRYFAS